MTDRSQIELLLRELYAARLRNDLDGVCRALAENARYQVISAGLASPVAIVSVGSEQYRRLLAQMLKMFSLSDHTIQSVMIDGPKAAVHWKAKVLSKITGAAATTEVVDLFEIKDGRIESYIEFCYTRSQLAKPVSIA
jgi:ketosteroid isomerase-like protein